jgi:putative ABC transport system permease protein
VILLRLISLPYVRKHFLRSILTMTGIVLGVAVFVGMHTANRSVLAAFNRTVDRIAGATQLQVTAGDGFPEETLERVQSVPGVRVAVPVIEAVMSTPFKGQGDILVLGVDMTGDRSLRDYDLESGDEAVVDDPLVFLAQPDSLIVTNTFAERNHLESGSRVPMETVAGPKQFVIRGIMKSTGMASAFGGNLAIMDIYAAQSVFGRGRTIDRIDIGANDGQDITQLRDRIRAALGSTYDVEPPAARGTQFEAMSRSYALTANMTSLFALFIGLFIIFNTFSIAVTQRRSEIGILRALGATRGQIRALFLSESVVIGLAGSAVGIFVGILLARGMAVQVSSLMTEVYGVGERAAQVTPEPKLLALALLIGVVTSVIAAILPSRNAARTDPVVALQKGRSQMISVGENRIRRLLSIGLATLAVLMLSVRGNRVLLYSGYVLAIFAAVLLAPTLTAILTRALRPVLRFLSPVEGALAADSLIQSPRRTSGTVAALMLSLALVIGLAGLAKASYSSILGWTASTLNPDLFVTPNESLTKRVFRFPWALGDQLRAVPGIEEVQEVRNGRITLKGKPVLLVAVNVRRVQARAHPRTIAGNREDIIRRASAGEALSVSENFAELNGVKLGDILEIPSPSGLVKLPVAGIVEDFSDQQGAIFLDWKVYKRYWQDDGVNIFRIYLHAGESQQAVKQRILERLGSHRRLFVMTNADVKGFIVRVTDQWFGMTYIQIAVAVMVAILGIVNTLTVSITDRRRELGVLQAVGALRRQVRRTVWIEALAIGVIGVLLGLGFGAIQLYFSVFATARDFAGLHFGYEYPFAIAAGLFPLILGAAWLSALAPAEQAVRGSLVESLEYE